jgi:hypothetical protein
MRLYFNYVKVNVFCVVSLLSEFCEQYMRFNRDCELFFSVIKFDKLSK